MDTEKETYLMERDNPSNLSGLLPGVMETSLSGFIDLLMRFYCRLFSTLESVKLSKPAVFSKEKSTGRSRYCHPLYCTDTEFRES